jgi:hypothetical protein
MTPRRRPGSANGRPSLPLWPNCSISGRWSCRSCRLSRASRSWPRPSAMPRPGAKFSASNNHAQERRSSRAATAAAGHGQPSPTLLQTAKMNDVDPLIGSRRRSSESPTVGSSPRAKTHTVALQGLDGLCLALPRTRRRRRTGNRSPRPSARTPPPSDRSNSQATARPAPPADASGRDLIEPRAEQILPSRLPPFRWPHPVLAEPFKGE